MKIKWLLIATLCFVGTVGCGDDANSKTQAGVNVDVVNNSTDTNSATNTNNSTNTNNVEPRDVRIECIDELVRLESCGQATTEEREVLEEMLCGSTQLTDGQVASVVGCLAQWECGGAVPACLDDTDPAPECSAQNPCFDGDECLEGVCQPIGGECFALEYAAGDVGDGTQQKRTGDSCLLPGECLSTRCVTGTKENAGDLDESESWCANSGDCRNPLNSDEECPSGFACREVPNDFDSTQTRWLCVKESLGPYCS